MGAAGQITQCQSLELTSPRTAPPADALKVITGQGMPSHRHHDFGNLYIRINVKFPDSIDPSVIPSLEAALPPRKPLGKIPAGKHMDEVMLEEPNERQRMANDRDENMEDDEEEGGRGPGVQCAQQ